MSTVVQRMLVAVWLILAASAAAAQEFDVFDLNDFVDPRLRDATFDAHGKLVAPGETFNVIRATTGAISDYAWRDTPTHGDVSFLHLADSLYFRDLQSNVKVTLLHAQSSSALPRYRVTTQFARYHMTEANTKVRESGVERVAGRTMVSLSIEDNPAFKSGRTRHFNTEVGVEIDTSMSLKGGRNASGAFVWVTRYQGVPETSTCGSTCYVVEQAHMQRSQRLSYEYRFDDRLIAERFRIGGAVGVGGLKTDRWHWGATRVGVRASADIGALGTLNFAWTPTYVPHDRVAHTTQEVALFIDRTMFARLRR